MYVQSFNVIEASEAGIHNTNILYTDGHMDRHMDTWTDGQTGRFQYIPKNICFVGAYLCTCIKILQEFFLEITHTCIDFLYLNSRC